jgi:hypothetical protein
MAEISGSGHQMNFQLIWRCGQYRIGGRDLDLFGLLGLQGPSARADRPVLGPGSLRVSLEAKRTEVEQGHRQIDSNSSPRDRYEESICRKGASPN